MKDIKFKYVFKKISTQSDYLEKIFTLDEIEFSDWRKIVDRGADWYTVGRFLFTGFVDKNGIEIYEGSICKGSIDWLPGDGYLKKIYPNTCYIKTLIRYNQPYEAKFDALDIGPMPGYEDAYNNVFYRGINYTLRACGNKDQSENRASELEVIGNFWDFSDIKYDAITGKFDTKSSKYA